MTYNLTNVTASRDWYQIIYAVNQLSNGLLFTTAVLLISITYFVVFKKQNFKDVFLAGNFFSAIISILLFAMKLVNSDFVIVPIIMFLAALLIYLFNND